MHLLIELGCAVDIIGSLSHEGALIQFPFSSHSITPCAAFGVCPDAQNTMYTVPVSSLFAGINSTSSELSTFREFEHWLTEKKTNNKW